MSKKTTVSGILLVLLVLATTPLLGTDNVSFLKWWLMTLVLGIGFYPAAAALFPRFHDRGWMFSKVLGIVVSGFAVFALGSFGLVPFTAPVCLITVGVLILASWIFGCFKVRVHAPEIDFLMMEEVLFFAFPSLDLPCGLSPGGTRNRKIHGLWFYEGHDAQHRRSGRGSLVQRKRY